MKRSRITVTITADFPISYLWFEGESEERHPLDSEEYLEAVETTARCNLGGGLASPTEKDHAFLGVLLEDLHATTNMEFEVTARDI